ncbi:MAG: hypothetical protein ABIO69_09370 [Sphingomicrobium sp.]
MNRQNWAKTLAAAVTAVSLATSSIASASPASVRSIDPLVALSVFGSAQSRSAMCAATAAAVTAAAAQLPHAAQGCVLPVADAPPPPVVSEAPPPPLDAAPAPVLAASTSLLPFFVGLGVVAALVLLLDRGNSGRIVFHVPVPNSPT